MDFNDVLAYRKSIRKFTSEPISQEDLEKILLAANSAPVGSAQYKHVQLSVITNRNILDELSKAVPVFLRDKAKMKAISANAEKMPEPVSGSFKIDPFYGAPLVIIVSHKGHDVQPGIEYANVGCICENMHLAATNIGLGSVFLWGVLEAMRLYPEFDTTSILNLPEDFNPIMGIAIGHPAVKPEPRTIQRDRLPVQYFTPEEA